MKWDEYFLKGLIQNDRPFFAHTKKGQPKETLEEHLEKTCHYVQKLIDEKELVPVINRLYASLFPEYPQESNVYNLFLELFVNVFYGHDWGKSNPGFQYRKMDNPEFKDTDNSNSKHSIFSAVIYYNHYYSVIEGQGEDDEIFQYKGFLLLMLNSYVISRHHSSLTHFSDFLGQKLPSAANCKKALVSCCETMMLDCFGEANNRLDQKFDLIRQFLFESEHQYDALGWVIYVRFLFSLLTAGDFYATSDYQNGRSIEDFGTIKDRVPWIMAFENNTITRAVRATDRQANTHDDINILRSQLFLDAEEVLLAHSKQNIFYLEAPTGSGKTNISIDLALQLIKNESELNRIVYVFPFNTLVEQTQKSLEKCFNKKNVNLMDQVAVINGITPIKEKVMDNEEGEWGYDGKNKVDYDHSILAREFLHYPMILTTHVHFFDILFGTRRESLFPLAHLANSVIIMDEIQSYKNGIWKEMIVFLKQYAKVLNMKIIIMSATLPDLDILSGQQDTAVRLNPDRNKYFDHPLFRNRVMIDYSLLAVSTKEDTKDALLKQIIKTAQKLRDDPKMDNKMIVECITKEFAETIYELIKNLMEEIIPGMQVELLTGDDHRAERKRIIDQFQNQKNQLIVATQVIEAGVDIDADAGFKDISILDAEEQFMGRVNRSCEKEGAVVYFFNYDNTGNIYKEDIRTNEQNILTQEANQSILSNKNFKKYYERILNQMEKERHRLNDMNFGKFCQEQVGGFNFEKVKNRMTLIDEDQMNVSLYLSGRTVETGHGTVDGSELWQRYGSLLKDRKMDYAERRVILSKVQADMDYFIYQVKRYDVKDLVYDDQIGDLLYIANGTRFLKNGKLDRKALAKQELFL